MSTDSPSTTDRLAEIKARLADLDAKIKLRAENAERGIVTPLGAAADRLHQYAPMDLEFLLSLVDSLQERLDTAEGRLARHAERHKPTEVFLEWHEFPVQSSKRTVCSGCSDFEAAQYQLWPCPEAVAFGLDEEPSDV